MPHLWFEEQEMAAFHCTIQYNTTQCNTISIQYNTMQCNTIQHNAMQHRTAQCNRIQCTTIKYNCRPIAYVRLHPLQSPYSFIHSGYFYSASSSRLGLLLRGAPDAARILCRSFTPKRHRLVRVKDLPKVPTWRLERDSNPRL